VTSKTCHTGVCCCAQPSTGAILPAACQNTPTLVVHNAAQSMQADLQTSPLHCARPLLLPCSVQEVVDQEWVSQIKASYVPVQVGVAGCWVCC
jgi:hypothetical protein